MNSHKQPESNQGFILTRHRREIAGTIYLEYWLTTAHGPVTLITPPQTVTFFIRQSDQPLAITRLNSAGIRFEYRTLSLKTFSHEPVGGLYFSTGKDCYRAKNALRSAEVLCFEEDIQLTERFLMERFIYGSACFSGLPYPDPTTHSLCFREAKLKPALTQPHFKVLSVDLECSEHGELYSIGLAASNFTQVIMIGSPQPGPDWVLWVPNEKLLIKKFLQSVTEYDPDIFIGWNVVNFDFRLLLKRASHHQVPLVLGRNHQPVEWRDARGEFNQGYVSMAGRVVIDGIDALKTATYHFDSFSLESVAQALLGKGKKIDNVDNRMAHINHDFRHNKLKLAEYNLQDCILVLEIFKKTNVLAFLTLRSQLTGLPLDRIGGSVAAFLNLYLPKLHRFGYISPKRPKSGGLTSPGGYVMRSKPGLYQNVLVLDFKSLYPAIIRTFKIDPLGLIEGLQHPKDSIPGYNGARFSREHHFLPDIIHSLWQQRDDAKKTQDTARSQAIKILMNSFYGILGSGGCPFYDPRLASSITLRGHDIMKKTAKWIEDAGYQVIYGDTDSLFVWLEGDCSNDKAIQIGQKLVLQINKAWDHLINQEYQLESALEIEFETHYKRFLMPTIRGSQMGSKKRYAGLKATASGDSLIFKGLETVRSDWTPLAKAFQTTLYRMIFSDQDVSDYLRQFVTDTRLGSHDHQLVYRKRLRRPLNRYIKNIPPHVKAARLADHINQSQGNPLRYQHRGTISYVMTLNGPEAIEHNTSPIDYEHYIEKQIRPIAEGILPFIEVAYDEVVNPQTRLI